MQTFGRSLLIFVAMAGLAANNAMAKDGSISTQCAEFDLNSNGQVELTDLSFIDSVFESNGEVAAWFVRGATTGCLSMMSPLSVTHFADHYQFCEDLNVDGDTVLSSADMSLIYGGSDFTVPEKLNALSLISDGHLSLGYSIQIGQSDSGGLSGGTSVIPTCVSVNPGWLSFSGVVEAMRDDLEICLEADMNGDAGLDVADLAIVANPHTRLTVEQRVNYTEAIRSRECAGGLE